MSGGVVLGLPPSKTTLSSAVVCSDYRRDGCAIVSTGWRDSFTEVCIELSIEEMIDGDLDRASL
jgi:hypothetical protein